MSTESVNWIEGHLWPNGFRRDAWMVVDTARDRRIYGMLLSHFYSQHTCLFSGDLSPELKLAAPYLIQLEHDDRKTRQFISHAWANSWGIFLKCDTRMKLLRHHLSRLLIARDASDNRLVFRYYDPRVLRVYLPTCTSDELHAIFGPIDRFLLEEGMPNTLLDFCIEDKQLNVTRLSLNQPDKASRI